MVLRMECREKDTRAVYGKVFDRENIETPNKATANCPQHIHTLKITIGPIEIALQLELATLAEEQNLIPNTHVAALKHA